MIDCRFYAVVWYETEVTFTSHTRNLIQQARMIRLP